jgi:outer membrane biosynthesis protein TonB
LTAARAVDGARLAGPLGVSAAGHALVFAAFIVFRGSAPPARPPMYHVNLVAAPAGARREGIVTPTPPPQPLAPTQPPPRAKIEAPAMPLPTKTPPRVAPPAATPTPVPAKAAAAATVAQAGGGPTGDRGTDVATVRTEGNDFPYPAYLENIVRQVAKNFGDHRNSTASAEVQFLIRRDGSVTSFRFLTRSGNYSYDLDAQGAVEAAGNARAFGPLPDGFSDDVLSVTFSFDPKVVH